MGVSVVDDDAGGSMTIVTSGSWERTGTRCCHSVPFSSTGSSERISVPSESCLNIRLTAMMPAAPVSAAKSAPT